jgi:TonB-like protein
MGGLRRWWVVVLVLAASSCHARRPPRVSVIESKPEGRTSVRVLSAPANGSAGLPDPMSERLTPAYASPDNKLPDYPHYALKAGCREGVVPVRVYVGPDGNVTSQRDVPGRPLPSDQCHSAFRAAVQSAVDAWKFAPAFRQVPYLVPDPQERQPPVTRWHQTAVTIFVDFEFLFSVVDGKGVVKSR